MINYIDKSIFTFKCFACNKDVSITTNYKQGKKYGCSIISDSKHYYFKDEYKVYCKNKNSIDKV